jgi:hypothetical protein
MPLPLRNGCEGKEYSLQITSDVNGKYDDKKADIHATNTADP